MECEKKKVDVEIEMWKKRIGELEPRVLALERDIEVLKRPEPNFCERMNRYIGVRNTVFREWKAENEAGSLSKVGIEMDMEYVGFFLYKQVQVV